MGIFSFLSSDEEKKDVNKELFLEECKILGLTDEEIKECEKAGITPEEWLEEENDN